MHTLTTNDILYITWGICLLGSATALTSNLKNKHLAFVFTIISQIIYAFVFHEKTNDRFYLFAVFVTVISTIIFICYLWMKTITEPEKKTYDTFKSKNTTSTHVNDTSFTVAVRNLLIACQKYNEGINPLLWLAIMNTLQDIITAGHTPHTVTLERNTINLEYDKIIVDDIEIDVKNTKADNICYPAWCTHDTIYYTENKRIYPCSLGMPIDEQTVAIKPICDKPENMPDKLTAYNIGHDFFWLPNDAMACYGMCLHNND